MNLTTWRDYFAPDCPLCGAWITKKCIGKPCWKCGGDEERAKESKKLAQDLFDSGFRLVAPEGATIVSYDYYKKMVENGNKE